MHATRKATKPYRTLEAAERAGYVADTECVADPAAGVMGIHAFNPALIDDKLDRRRPEVLVYAKSKPHGPLRLAALEYVAPDPDGDPATDDRPELFGHPFDGPFPGAGDAPVYLLHAWVHKRNPAGVFAQFNPRAFC